MVMIAVCSAIYKSDDNDSLNGRGVKLWYGKYFSDA